MHVNPTKGSNGRFNGRGTHGGGPHISGTPDFHDTLTDKIVRQKWSNKKINATWKAQERRR